MRVLAAGPIEGAMDAITHGWPHGHEARIVDFGHWEQQFARPLVELRRVVIGA
jgi:ubiquinone biosynthesis protein Coq4